MRKTILIAIAVIMVITTLIGAIFILGKWNKPLGESLEMPTRTPVSQQELVDTPTAVVENIETAPESAAVLVPTATLAPTTAQPVCGGPPLMYILGVGADSDDPEYLYGLADVIRIVRVDFVTPKVSVLTLPRDLWVELPDIKEQFADKVPFVKLNQAYFYGGPGMGYYEGPGGGPGLLARTIAHNYDLYVDHYGAVNMLAFTRIVDALGGIDIYLDQDWDGRPVDEKTIDLGYFTAGQHHMSGAEALRFSRIRKKYSEVTRTDNQTLVICAIKDKLTEPEVIGTIPDMIKALMGTIQTDLTPAQISQLTCLLPKLGGDNLQFVRFPDEMMVQSRVYDPHLQNETFIWDIPIDYIRQYLKDFENDAIPFEAGEGMTCP